MDPFVKNILIVLNDPPYGTERSYNGLRLAVSLASRPGTKVRLFLIGDAAACGKAGQHVPEGYYNIEQMLSTVAAKGAEIGVCGSCLDARGIGEEELTAGAQRSNLGELTTWAIEADSVITF